MLGTTQRVQSVAVALQQGEEWFSQVAEADLYKKAGREPRIVFSFDKMVIGVHAYVSNEEVAIPVDEIIKLECLASDTYTQCS